jgi:DNA end-binding protein Ku
MPQRPIWRGHLRLALVSCPIALFSANHDRGSLHFNLINPKTGNRIKMVAQDAETKQPLKRTDLVKGYEYTKGKYIILEDEDFESAHVESSKTIKIDKFVEANSIDPIYFNSSYYMAPDGSGGEDVYVVLRDAIASTGKVALSRVVIARREHPVAIMPMSKGLVVHTLLEERDLNDYSDLFDDLPSAKPDPDMVQLAKQLIDRQTGRYDAADVEDRYETRLRALIDAKMKGKGLEPEAEDEKEGSNVIDLMAALRKSLGQGTGTSGPTKSPAGSLTKKTKSGASSRAAGENKTAGASTKKSGAAKPAARRRA